MNRNRKPVELKEVREDGTVVCVFATMNVIDKDGDITLPGFFGEQDVVMLPAHDWRSVPLGKGTIREVGDKAVAEIKMNLAIPAARDWHSHLKFDLENGKPLQQYSYGFTVLAGGSSQGGKDAAGKEARRTLRPCPDGKPGCKAHEVSPVVVGAGEGTGTLAVKGMGEGMRSPKVLACLEACYACIAACLKCLGLCKAAGLDECAAMCAACLAACADCVKVCSSGDMAACMAACSKALAACRSCLEACDKTAVSCQFTGLAECAEACLRCVDCCRACIIACEAMSGAGAEPMKGHRFEDEAAAALDAVEGIVTRAGALAALRAKDGRGLSSANVEKLGALRKRLKAADEALAPLLVDEDVRRAARAELGRAMKAGHI